MIYVGVICVGRRVTRLNITMDLLIFFFFQIKALHWVVKNYIFFGADGYPSQDPTNMKSF